VTALQLDIFSPQYKEAMIPAAPSAPVSYRDPFMASIQEKLDAAGDDRLTFDEATWDHTAHGAVGLDVEVYQNCLIICFKRFADGTRVAFERSTRADFRTEDIWDILRTNVIVTFNGYHYDLPVIGAALAGATPATLKSISDRIVLGGLRPWQMEEALGVRVPRVNHIDLMEPNPAVRQGLKMIYARLHGRYVVDLPYAPEATLTFKQTNVVTLYCFNDLDATELLYKTLREPLELRVALGKKYGLDFRSRSDSQMGEAIVKKIVETTTHQRISATGFTEPSFNYTPPAFITFSTSTLNEIVGRLATEIFMVNGAGKVVPPKFLENLQLRIGRMAYTMGIGGLHSTEAHRALLSDDTYFLLDVDVASQYPNIIMKAGLYPKALGPEFLTIYGELIRDRLAAKAAGDKVRADGGRIALNGVFGKLGSPHSPLYSPNLLIAVTLTGQLAILMLIERAESAGITVVSANTDGIVFYCPRARATALDRIIADWEALTNFTVERTPYRALYNSSVNTYIAIREDGKVKRKGAIADPWSEGDLRGQIMKNPQMTICTQAVVKFLTEEVPLERTIMAGQDPRAFVTIIKVTDGATWRGHYLGRTVRYYWSLDGEPIMAKGHRRVPKTEGARPLLELTAEMPPDIDRLRYCVEAAKLLRELGV